MPTYSTASTILTQVRAECGVGSNPKSTALQNTSLLRFLNDINSEFVNLPYIQGLTGWKFLLRETIISTVANTTLNGALASGATSMVLTSGTSFDDPAATDVGAGYVKTGNSVYDFFTYEDRATNTLSTVAGLNMAHATLEEVHKVYKLPSDFGKIRNIFRRSSLYSYVYVDPDFTQVPRGDQFTIRVFTSTNNYSASFLIFREDIGALEFKVQYVKAPTTIDETTDSVDAPDGTPRRYIVERMKEYVWSHLGEENDAILAKQRADILLREAFGEWAVQHVQPLQSIQLSW